MLVVLACLLTLGSGVAANAATPLDGRGMWIWYVEKSGGTAKRIAKRAKAHDVSTVFIKSSDGKNAWSQFTPALVKNLQRKGLNVCAWQFVYGDRPGPEAVRGADAKAKGADCLIIDAETAYEGKYRAADHYMTKLRKLVGKRYPLALSSFPYTDYHPSLPYSVFLGKGAAQYNMPQMYWKAIGTTVKGVFKHTYEWNVPYDRPIFPTGQTYEDPGTKQIRAFRKEARARRARGVNWWSWQETDNKEFRAVGAKLSGRVPPPATVYPLLRKGSKGDLVVLTQELLRAAGYPVYVDGTFGNKTAQALRAFQKDKRLKQTGATYKATWTKLLKRRPDSTDWWHRKNGMRARATTMAAPASATLGNGRLEFQPPPR